jgi:hypothetical protein
MSVKDDDDNDGLLNGAPEEMMAYKLPEFVM